MNSPHLLAPWLAPLGWLALEATVVILAALALQPLLRTAAARRTLSWPVRYGFQPAIQSRRS